MNTECRDCDEPADTLIPASPHDVPACEHCAADIRLDLARSNHEITNLAAYIRETAR